MMKMLLVSAVCVFALVGCSTIPPEAYFERGTPESLLDVSSEIVNLTINDQESLDQLVDWVNEDQPSRAELYCQEGDALCREAQTVFEQFGVPTFYASVADNAVVLIYDRVLARDCENRFIDNTINPYNLNHPTQGCSIASNMVQMIGDKQQLVSPALADYPDALKGTQAIKNYKEPVDFAPPAVSTDFQSQFELEGG